MKIPASLRTTLAVVVTAAICTTSSAFAAAKLTGANIANGSITGIDIKNNSLGSADLTPQARAALQGKTGPQGLQGPQGQAGVQGQQGIAAWDVIPSGTTVRGSFLERRANDVAGSGAVLIELPARTAADMPVDAARFAASDVAFDPDPACTGTVAEPTAPAGKLCIYTYTDTGVKDASASAFRDPINLRGAVRVTFQSLASNVSFSGSWAYTAP